MRIIYTKHFPPGDFHGINILGTVFVQRRWGKMAPHELNHEFIHTLQQWEMTPLLFYLWYAIEFLIRLCQCRFDSDRAYYAISLEREAYAHERNPRYHLRRRPYAWLRYLRRPHRQSPEGTEDHRQGVES